MSYQALARKWRPKSFATLVGQEHVVLALTHALERRRLHHAYLFTGTRGVGKTTLARIMAKALNCEAGIGANPCGVCSACSEIDSGRFIDYIELDAASNRGVDDMTQLLERSVYAPTRGRYKVYVIDEVHQLTGHAFNAMLKTLEEPPEHVKFILATTDPQKIPVTVLSRCLQFNLKQMSQSDIVDHLARVLTTEAIHYEPTALRQLAKAAAGSMRDALSLLDQAIAHGAGEVKDANVQNMLGTVADEHLFSLLDGLITHDVDSMVSVAALIEARSLSFDSALQELATLFHRIALVQMTPNALLDSGERNRLLAYSGALDPEYLQLCYQIAIHGRDELALAPDEYAGFVMTLLRLHAFRPMRIASENLNKLGHIGPPKTNQKVSAPVMASAPRGNPTFSVPAVKSEIEDWHSFVGELPTGMIKQLAQRCELISRNDGTVVLRLAPEYRHLQTNQEKLQAALRSRWGSGIQLDLSIGQTESETPATRRLSSEQSRQDKALDAIVQDPFVRQVVDLFSADIELANVKPI